MKSVLIYKENLFAGEKVLITGGGSGIGFAIARYFGSLGAEVIIAARDVSRLETAAEQLNNHGIQVTILELNIRDEERVEAVFAELKANGNLPDVLVNNAGGQFAAHALDISANGFRSVVDLNLTGTWHMCKTMAQYAQDSEKTARIINIVLCSASGLPGMVHSAAARAGVVNMTKTLAYEWGRLGVRINAVAPGTIETGGLDNYDQDNLKETTDSIPIPRFGSAEEVAAAVAYLASPAADFITGTTLEIDGGEHLTGAREQVKST